jgi:hypothetical protein
MKNLFLISALLFSAQAKAVDETDLGVPANQNVKGSVSYSKETYKAHDADYYKNLYFWTVRSGDVGASADTTSHALRGDVYSTLGKITTLGDKWDLLNKAQLEVHASSNGTVYGLLGAEVPVPSMPVAIFAAAVANNDTYRTIIGGPELYWKNSFSRLTIYPTQAEFTDSNVKSNGAVTLRNTIKEFGDVATAEVDLIYKRVTDGATPKEGFGFALGMNIWRLGLLVEQSPFWETSDYDRTQLSMTWNYQM